MRFLRILTIFAFFLLVNLWLWIQRFFDKIDYYFLGGFTISGYFGQHEHPIHGNFRSHCLRHRSFGQGCRHRRRRRTSGKDCSGHPLRCLQRLRRLKKASRPSIIHATQIAANAMEDSFKNRNNGKTKRRHTTMIFSTFFLLLQIAKNVPSFLSRTRRPSQINVHYAKKLISVHLFNLTKT